MTRRETADLLGARLDVATAAYLTAGNNMSAQLLSLPVRAAWRAALNDLITARMAYVGARTALQNTDEGAS